MPNVYRIIATVSITLGALWIWVATSVFAPMRHLDPRLKVRYEGLPTAVSDEFFALSTEPALIVAGLVLLDARKRWKSKDDEL
jgi:hypothetical protein